jgi:hypothetical protein
MPPPPRHFPSGAGRSEGNFMFPVSVAAVRNSDDQPVGEAVALAVDTTLG